MTLSDAIFSTYPISSDSFQLNWNNVLLPLTFNSLSDIIDDVIVMMDKIVLGANFKHSFLCESFTVFLSFNIHDLMMTVTPEWISLNVNKEIFDLLNSDKKILTVNRREFLSEWLDLLLIVVGDLKKVGYNFPDIDSKMSVYFYFLRAVVNSDCNTLTH